MAGGHGRDPQLHLKTGGSTVSDVASDPRRYRAPEYIDEILKVDDVDERFVRRLSDLQSKGRPDRSRA